MVKKPKQWIDWRELADDLVASVNVTGKWLCWVNQPLGSVQSDHVGVADVVSLYESYNPVCRVYEIKISHSDFLADFNAGKYQRYLPHCSQMYFAAPKGIIKPEEVPPGTGLITRGDAGWHVAKGAPKHDWKPDSNMLLALTFSLGNAKKQARNSLESPMLNGKRNTNPNNYLAPEYDGKMTLADLRDCDLRRFSKHYGHEIARKIAEGKEIVDKAEELKKRIETSTEMRFHGYSFESVAAQLESHIKTLYSQRENLEDVILLCDLLGHLARGNYQWFNISQTEELLKRVHAHQEEIEKRREEIEKEVKHGSRK